MKNKKKIKELNYFNAICCLGVILIHVLSFSITYGDKGSFLLTLCYLPWKVMAFVVPGFLFSGAMKMSHSFGERESAKEYFAYIGKRLKKIVLPYALWVLIYYVVLIAIGYEVFSARQLLKHFLLGTLSSQFYYIIITVQFYLLRPLWKFVQNKVPMIFGLILALGVTYASYNLTGFLAGQGITFLYADRIFTTYIIFWVAGLYAGKNSDRFFEIIKKYKTLPIICLSCALGFAFVCYYQYYSSSYFAYLDYIKVFSDLASICFVLFVCTLIERAAKLTKLKATLNYIHKASFSVYLSHCLFLILSKYFLQKNGIYGIMPTTITCLLSATTIPFLIYALQSFVSRKVSDK